MQQIDFKGLGTVWTLLIDTDDSLTDLEEFLVGRAQEFEQRFSRFLVDSEVNAFRTASAGTYPISAELAVLLTQAAALREVTRGAYNPAIGAVLERAGYGGKEQPAVEVSATQKLATWSLHGQLLEIDGPIAFDLGGIGKGYLIDELGKHIARAGYLYYLVDGGGDLYGTTKRDGQPWRAAVEYPGQPELAASVVELRYQGLAVSDVFRRRFGRHHHVIDATTEKSVERVVGCAALAPTAWAADCMTSGLFLGEAAVYEELRQMFSGEYLVFRSDGQALVSPKWPGEIFR